MKFVVIVRNDAWLFPDVFGPFDSLEQAEEFLEVIIVAPPEDVTVQQLLPPEDYI